ncbi:MAG: hypothetical protein COB10_08885 [Planctomycetota bacterium]|nr:MAG: hypothetical protein COB10_08885 [Planctomycetota bacterium]
MGGKMFQRDVRWGSFSRGLGDPLLDGHRDPGWQETLCVIGELEIPLLLHLGHQQSREHLTDGTDLEDRVLIHLLGAIRLQRTRGIELLGSVFADDAHHNRRGESGLDSIIDDLLDQCGRSLRRSFSHRNAVRTRSHNK